MECNSVIEHIQENWKEMFAGEDKSPITDGLEGYLRCVGLLKLGETEAAEAFVERLLSAQLAAENRLQETPPYLSLMVYEIYRRTGNRNWLSKLLPGLKAEYAGWEKTKTVFGLNRYGQTQRKFCGIGICERFSGNVSDYIPVDLNSNLYRYERNFGFFEGELGNSSSVWENLAEERKKQMNALLWNSRKKLYLDYDCARGRLSEHVTCASFQPYFVEMAEFTRASGIVRLLSTLKRQCERGGGLACAEETYYLASEASARYHYAEVNFELERKFLRSVEENFTATGRLCPEQDALRGECCAASTAGMYLAFVK